MAVSDKTIPRVIDNMAIPYKTRVNIATVSAPYFTGGYNLLAQKDSPLTKRPGFPGLYSTTQFGAGSRVRRVFTWSRWNGTFYTMFAVTNAGATESRVYNGTTLIHTDTTSTEPFDFVVSNNHLFFANGVNMMKWDGATVSNWGIAGPTDSDTPTISNAGAGNVPGVVGHTYVFAYGNSTTGHVSDISLPSTATNAANRKWDVTGPKSTDTQVDKVHIYRSEDGSFNGPWLELSNSPIANPGGATWTIQDNDFDTTSTSTPRLQGTAPAPTRGRNRRPPASKGPVLSAGRIWTFQNDMVHNSGLEEISVGVPEESFPVIGQQNGQPFGQEVFGLGVLADSDISLIMVFTGSDIHYIAGDSLNTFRIGVLLKKRGCRQRATIFCSQLDSDSAQGGATFGFVTWLDTSNTVRMMTTNSGVRHLSADIIDDIATIDHTQASITVHEDADRRWLVLCDGGAEILRVLDLQRGEWNVPWPITDAFYIATGEVSAGTWKLFLSLNTGAVYQMSNTVWADGGTNFGARMDLMLAPVMDPSRPEQVGSVEYVGFERNATDIDDIAVLHDEDPYEGTPTYTSILANETDPFLRKVIGTNLVEKWYYIREDAGTRRLAVRIDWL